MTCLDRLSIALEEKDIRWASLNRIMTLTERSQTIDAFENESDPKAPAVLLITTNSGNYGLTLTVASAVIMLDNSWTPLGQMMISMTE